MNEKKEIGAGQLFALLVLSRLSVVLTFPFNWVGSFNNQEWFVSLLFFPVLLFIMLWQYFLFKKTGLSPCQAADRLSPFAGKAVCLLFSLFFLISAAVSLSRFNIFMTSTTGAKQSPVFFPLLLIIPALYAAFKGLEPISRTACIALAVGVFSVGLIIFAVLPDFDLLNISSPAYYGKKEAANLIRIYISNTSEVLAFALLLPKTRGNHIASAIGFSAACCLGMLIIFFSVTSVFGELTVIENFPFFALADVAELGELKQLSALHASTWVLGFFVKCGLFLYLSYDCAKKFIPKKFLCPFSAAGAVLTFALGTLMSSSYSVSKSRIYSDVMFWSIIFLGVLLPAVLLFAQKKTDKCRSKEGVEN